MSFSQAIKDDLCRLELNEREQALELATALLLNARFYANELSLATSHLAFSERLRQDFNDVLGLQTDLSEGRELYTLRLEGRDALEAVGSFLEETLSFDTFHGRFQGQGSEFSDEDERSILRFMYLAGGSVSDPTRSYHLELACRRLQVAKFCIRLMSSQGIHASLIKRYGSNVVYLKDGQQISDYLGIIGAHLSLLQFESLRVEKDMRNNVNRMVNCDTANAQRIANTAFRQLEALHWYEENIGLDKLPDDLLAAAGARLEYPELSLAELGALLDPPLGKSGMNHRLKKLEAIIDQSRKDA